MDPWYRVVTPRREVREGRSFNPDEFAIALDQVVDGTAPDDYRDPEQFFSRTFFTQALTEHTGTVLRRLSGRPRAPLRYYPWSPSLGAARPTPSRPSIIWRGQAGVRAISTGSKNYSRPQESQCRTKSGLLPS